MKIRRVVWILVDTCFPRGPHGAVYKTYRCTTRDCRAMCTIPSIEDIPPPDRCWKCGTTEE